ncbi:MAG: thioredoxin family protein [Oscillospiraceae bacterium]|jgi:thiol-disulfide isomerase/thioredoxin
MNTSFVNFWNNGRGICIAEMPELEELCQELIKLATK